MAKKIFSILWDLFAQLLFFFWVVDVYWKNFLRTTPPTPGRVQVCAPRVAQIHFAFYDD
jgi:hypothetical protein